MDSFGTERHKNVQRGEKRTEPFALLERSPHRRAGGAVTVTNAAPVFNGAGLHHIVTANLLQRASKETAFHVTLHITWRQIRKAA